ncbi:MULTISPECIES: MATE family efflux transporter [Agrobacterium]|uniref:Multidrug-efflux transporter n=1 Tax=Agrobacterium larrymoorei TaxID=160699 RepID=A0AAJ2ESD7_9HYPH|nr:MATE family efflux transporter [Agrobacterium larrymoorei]MDQ1198991.1 MATE family multidrug resistance protein [Rhizobium sp. SORGH_AS_0787]MDR6102819.1 MATE family multidrug resistance protein [Agrobacterium larrymoorei]
MSSSEAVGNVSQGGSSWAAHLRATLALGIPLIGAQLAQLGIHTTDMIIVGQLGAEKLAAMVLAGQFFFVVFIFGSGFSVAVVPMVANAYGQGDATSARRALRMGMWVAIAYWLLALGIFHNAERILVALGQNPNVAKLTGDYLAISKFGMLPGLLFYVMRGLVSAIGRASIVLYATIAMLLLNGVLAYGLVLGHFGLPAMGMNGAAVVAVIVNLFSLVFIVLYIQTQEETRQYELFVRFWKPDWKALGEVLRLGLPISITILAEVTLFSAASILIGQIGTIELAAHGIALQLASLAFMIPLGLSQAATVRIGVAHGRGDYPNLIRAAITVYAVACVIAICGGILFALVPERLGSLFLDGRLPEAPQVLAYASTLIVMAGLFQLVDGIQAVAAGLLRGLKDARVPALLALISYWPIGLGLAWTMAFPLGFGGVGVWSGFVVGLSAAAIMLTTRFYLLVKREMKTAGKA